MKITITADGGSPIVLGDDAEGEYVSGDLPEQTRAHQIRSPSRADYITPLDRVTRTNSMGWLVERAHDTEDEAITFKHTHAQAVPNNGLICVSHNDHFNLWYAGAQIVEVRCVFQAGQTTRFQYRFVAGEALTQNPNL